MSPDDLGRRLVELLSGIRFAHVSNNCDIENHEPYNYSVGARINNIRTSGVARPKLMVGPDYRGTKEVLEDLAQVESDRSIQQLPKATQLRSSLI